MSAACSVTPPRPFTYDGSPVSSDPMFIPGARSTNFVYSRKMSPIQKLRTAEIMNNCCFKYHIESKVKLYINAIIEFFEAECFSNATQLFFEMEDEVFHKFTFDKFENSLHRKESFLTRSILEEKLILTDPDLFFNRLNEVKSGGRLKSNPLFNFILLYEYFRSILFDVKMQNLLRAHQTYLELQKSKLLSAELPIEAELQSKGWKEALKEIETKFFSVLSSEGSPFDPSKKI